MSVPRRSGKPPNKFHGQDYDELKRKYEELMARCEHLEGRLHELESFGAGDDDDDEVFDSFDAFEDQMHRENEAFENEMRRQYAEIDRSIEQLRSTLTRDTASPIDTDVEGRYSAEYTPDGGFRAGKLEIPKFKGVQFTTGDNGFRIRFKFGH